MSRRVLLIHAGLRDAGGVTVDVLNLAAGLERRGHEVAVARTSREAARAVARRPTVVHAFGCLPTAPSTFAAMVLARARGIPVVWTPVFHPSRGRSWKGYGALRAMRVFDSLAPRAARLTDAVVAATAAEADYFSRVGVRRVEVIPPGVDSSSDMLAPADRVEAFRKRVGLNGGPVLLTVARDNSRKALPFGLEVYDRLRERRPAAQLLLVGPGPDYAGARRGGVACPGWLGPDDIELAYLSADVLFVPSLYEALPRSVIEAWRHGLAVVATDRVALAPTIDGQAGEVVPYGDAGAAASTLDQLLSRPDLLDEYGRAGCRLVDERFALDDVVGRTAALYEELAS